MITFPFARGIADSDSLATLTPLSRQTSDANSEYQKNETLLIDSIMLVRSEIEQLQSVIERSTFGLPSYYYASLRSWIIPSASAFNDTLALYFFETSENDSTYIQQRGDIQIIATTGDTVDIVGILFSGNEQEKKGQRLRELLLAQPGRNMYSRVLFSGMYGEERLLVTDEFKAPNNLRPRLIKNSDIILSNFSRIDIGNQADSPTVRFDLRIPDKTHIQFGQFWGIEWKLGNEEINYPFWLSGNMAIRATYKQIRIGVQVPLAGGRSTGESLGKLLPVRRLDGTFGVQAAFDVGFAGGSLMIGQRRTDVDGSYFNIDSIHTVRNFAQVWYSYAVAVGRDAPKNLMRFKLGLGFHQIGFDMFLPERAVIENGVSVNKPAEIHPADNLRSFWSPYINADFMNQQFAHRFGASLQYYNEWAMMTLWLEVVRDFVRIELKGGAPLLRQHYAWEPTYFALLNVPVTFSF